MKDQKAVDKLIAELKKEKKSTTPIARGLRRKLRRLGHYVSKKVDKKKVEKKKKTVVKKDKE